MVLDDQDWQALALTVRLAVWVTVLLLLLGNKEQLTKQWVIHWLQVKIRLLLVAVRRLPSRLYVQPW